ncbi:MAG: TonB-dependent receptor, partial [Pseudomonadota bacterium]
MNIRVKFALNALLGTTAMTASHAALAQEAAPVPPITDDVIVVRGINIPDEKRATSEISAVLDEASFQRTGDSDIASALGRVTGLSVSEGKYVIVRGLNERYSSVTIDGSPLPSPEPLRRVVPLDIIPTSILSGSLVQKTYSPQFSGEFGGGVIELRTKPVPDEWYLNVGGSIGLDTVTSFQDGLTHDGGDTDWLGFDDGTRNTPPLISGSFFTAPPVSVGQCNRITSPENCIRQNLIDSSLEPSKTSVIFEDETPPNWGISGAGGGFHDLTPDIRLGFNIAAGFGNTYQTREGRREQGLTTSGANASLRPFEDPNADITNTAFIGDFTSTSLNVDAYAAVTLGAEIGDNHEINATNLILRSTLKDTRITNGIDGDQEDFEFQRENIEFFERQVWQSQLRGEHIFPSLNDLTVNWRAAYGEAFRDAPYQRSFQRLRGSADEEFGFASGFNAEFDNGDATVTFSKVEDQNLDAGADFVLPIDLFGDVAELKAGWAYTDKDRDSIVREFFYLQGSADFPEDARFVRPDVFVGDIAASDILDLTFTTNPTALDNAESQLIVNAYYVGADVPVGPYLRFAAGGRFEEGSLTTLAFATGTPNSIARTEIDEEYFLPAFTITYNPFADLQVRAAFSQTITRPQFRELTPATFLDDDTDQFIVGNPFLVDSEIDNFDVRGEYYLGRGQFITLGLFYKDITNPIEATSTQIGGADAQTFVNAPSAEVFGFEFEYEQNLILADFFDQDMFETKDLILKANYTFTES